MASSTGGHVSGYGYNWYTYLYVNETARTQTTISYYVEVGFYTNQRIAESCYISGNAINWSGSLNSMGQSNGVWHQYYLTSKTVTYTMGSAAQAQTIWAGITTTGGYSNGTSTASLTIEIPQRSYSLPNAPRNFSATRVSDKSQKLSWAGDYTGLDGDKPWSGIYVDRKTDGGSWATIATLTWSATSYSDNTTSAGHLYTYRVRSYNSAGNTASSSINVYTSPTSFGSITAALPNANAITLKPASLPTYYDGVQFQETTDGSTWKDKTVTLSAVGTWTDSNPTAGTVTYRGRAYKTQGGSQLWSSWATSNQLVTLRAPLAPGLPTLESVYPINSTLTITWTPNHLDGTAQTKAQVEITTPDGEASTVDISGSETSYTVELGVAGTYKVRVRTYGLYAAWGAWSSYSAFSVAALPSVWFTYPTEEDQQMTLLPFTLKWVAADDTGIAYQELSILDIYGNSIMAKSLDTDVREFEVDSTVGLMNEQEYICSLYVRGGSDLTARASATLTTLWQSPEQPTCTVTFDDNLAAHVLIAENFFTAGKYEAFGSILTGPMNRRDSTHIAIGGEVETESYNLPWKTATSYAGYDTQNMTFLAVQASTQVEYRCIVTLADGTVETSNTATFTLLESDSAQAAEAASDTTVTASIASVAEGETATATVNVSDAQSYEWQFRAIANKGIYLIIHDLPATTSYSLIRETDERRTVLLAAAKAGEEFVDYLPPLNVDYDYTVVAYSEVGSSSQNTVTAHCDSDGYEAFNFGENGETAVLLRYNANDSESSSHSGESFHFALGDNEEELPTFYPDGDIDVTGSRSYIVLDKDTYKRVRAQARSNPLGWFRGVYGNRARVQSSWKFGYQAEKYNQWTVDADVTEVVWTEPENVG